jgi:hypothetical protein
LVCEDRSGVDDTGSVDKFIAVVAAGALAISVPLSAAITYWRADIICIEKVSD